MGLVQTGALNSLARKMVELGVQYPRGIIVATLIVVMVTSAFLNNTPVVVIFIPILVALAEKLGQQASAVMMPLSFAAILGGNLTIIGSSTNLLVVGAYEQQTGNSFGFFTIYVDPLDISQENFAVRLSRKFEDSFLPVICPRKKQEHTLVKDTKELLRF